MTLRLVADENVDHRVVHRLDHYGHDTEHVDFVDGLGKGVDDAAIARYSLDCDRLLLTSDDDFLTDFSEADHGGVLFIPDGAIPSETIADAVHAISNVLDQDDVSGIVYVSTNWL